MRARKEVSSPIILPAALKRRSTPAEVIFYKYFYKYRIYISIILSFLSKIFLFGKIGKTQESVFFEVTVRVISKKTQRSKVRVFEGAVYRNIAVFGRKSSSEGKNVEDRSDIIKKSKLK